MLTFDEKLHHYYWNGAHVPNTTTIISDLTCYDFVKPEQLEIARQRGTAVHRMIELISKKEEFDLPAWMLPVQEKWMNFVGQTGLEVVCSERRCFHKTYTYATTLDLCVKMRDREGLGILEIKRSFCAGKAIGLQTAAQAAAYESETGQRIQWRAALKINENTAVRFEDQNDRQDWSKFLACLLHYNLVKECRG